MKNSALLYVSLGNKMTKLKNKENQLWPSDIFSDSTFTLDLI